MDGNHYSTKNHEKPILKTRRFFPLFVTQFLGAFNDNVFKSALLIWITYTLPKNSGYNTQVIVTMASGIFILPFFIFSATAGQLADKYEKSKLIQIIKLVEIFLMLGCSLGFYRGSLELLMLVLFLMGSQSAFFGPLKYSIIPQHLKKDELIGGNAIIEAGTFLAILMGTMWGSLLIRSNGGIELISGSVVLFSVLGWISSLYIPGTVTAAPKLKVSYNIVKETWSIVAFSRKNSIIFFSIAAVSWFWFIGATFLSQFPIYAKDILGADEKVVTLFLTIFSIGIGVGSLLCNKLLKGKITAKYVPLCTLGMMFFTIDLFFASKNIRIEKTKELIGAIVFLKSFGSWRIIADLLFISVFAGIYIVPLYTIMQSSSEPSHLSRIIAANNVMNALFMVLSAIFIVIMFYFGLSVTHIFLVTGLLNGIVYVLVRNVR